MKIYQINLLDAIYKAPDKNSYGWFEMAKK